MDLSRLRRLAAAGFRLWREQGTAALLQRLRLRRNPGAPRLPRLALLRDLVRAPHVPQSENPEISIIIRANGGGRPTRRCLASIARTTEGLDVEVLLPGTAPESARGAFLLYLSGDSIVMEGAIQALRDVFERRPQCRAAGPMLLDMRGRLPGGGDPDLPEHNYLREVDSCPPTALMVRRGMAGGTTWCQPAARIHQRQPERVYERGGARTVLVIDHQVPMPDRDAGSLFMTRFLSALAAAGYRTAFWPDNLLRTDRYTALLQADGIEVLYGNLSFDEFIRSRRPAFAIVYRSSMAEKYLPALAAANVPAGYIAVDLEHVREARRVEVNRDANAPVDALRERERGIVQSVRGIGVHSPVEAGILREELGARNVVELPLPLTAIRNDAPPGFESREGLLFLGSMHPPNVDAARHLAERLLPRIRERIDVRLEIAGEVRGGIRDLARAEAVSLPGHVDDLAACFDRHRVFAAPVRFGAGLKGKILEAMNHGIPVVTTSVGAEGIGLTHGETAMIADDDDAFVEHVVALHSDRELWTKLHDAGRRFIQERFSEHAFRKAVDAFLRQLT